MIDDDIKNLINKAKEGDNEAFAKVYNEYLTPIYRFIYFRVSNKDDADDLTQEVFIRVFNSLERFNTDNQAPLSYFYTVARNLLIDSYRKKKVISIDTEEIADLITTEDNPETEAILKENIINLKQALEQISESEKEVLILKYINDYTNSEISKIMGKSEDSVRQLQSRGIRSLRKILTKNNF